MRTQKTILTILAFLGTFPMLYAQTDPVTSELGINAGGFTNFQANKNYLKDDMGVFYVAPYVRAGRHEFSAGILFPLGVPALDLTDEIIHPRPGFLAGYTFYIFPPQGRENLFIHYAFQYLRYRGEYNIQQGMGPNFNVTEKDMYINNVIGLGYHLFFDRNERFGFYYTLDYVISQRSYTLILPEFITFHPNAGTWTTRFAWNNLSTHVGFSFKLTSLNKHEKKQK